MQSIAQHTYPQVVWREGRKMLWNPIHRKPLENRPEERVRLRIIEYLLMAGWSKYRITTEEAIGNLADTGMRTDIICYSQQFEPRILIECKAEHIPITDKTGQQVARYNQNVSAPFLLMTNGRVDYWHEVDGSEIRKLDGKPDILKMEIDRPSYDFEDWRQRGFAGDKASPPLRKWMAVLLPSLWHNDQNADIRFLSFSQELTDLNLNHYYVLQGLSGGVRLAVSTLSTAYGGSRLVGILNEENQNKAVLEINLDLAFDGKTPNGTLYSQKGQQSIDAAADLDLPESTSASAITGQIGEVLTKYLD